MTTGSADPQIRALGRADAQQVQDLLEATSEYSMRVDGCLPAADAGAALFDSPPGWDGAAPVVFGAFTPDARAGAGPRLDAVAVTLVGWPDRAETCYIALLLVRADRHRSGLGRFLHDEIVRRIDGVDRMRLAIVDTNREGAEPFWRALGYRPTGETKPYSSGPIQSTTRIYTLDL